MIWHVPFELLVFCSKNENGFKWMKEGEEPLVLLSEKPHD